MTKDETREDLERRLLALHVMNATNQDLPMAPSEGLFRGLLSALVAWLAIGFIAYLIYLMA